MPYDPEIHHRRSIRLKGYDYTQAGAYFITVCAKDQECLFGKIINGKMALNEFGRIVEDTWNDLVNHIDHIKLDSFVVMPNHIHGIIVIVDGVVGAGSEPAPTIEPAPTADAATSKKRYGIPEIIRQFKTFSSRRINEIRDSPGIPVWQRNYYENIVRDENALHQIRRYIIQNPLNWKTDEQNILIH